MKKLWVKFGVAAFWLSWPLLFIYLFRSRRTRILVVSGNKVLVLKNWLSNGGWILPGGGLHGGEEPRAGAARELLEETGIKIVPEQLKELNTGRFTHGGLRFTYHSFVVELSESLPPKPQRFEVVLATWMDWRELLADKRVSPEARQILESWFAA